jgi:hypothetical protein
MKMGNEDVGDLAAPDLVFDHLYLGAFAAINQEEIAIYRHDLARRMPVECRYCRIVSQDCNSEHEWLKVKSQK